MREFGVLGISFLCGLESEGCSGEKIDLQAGVVENIIDGSVEWVLFKLLLNRHESSDGIFLAGASQGAATSSRSPKETFFSGTRRGPGFIDFGLPKKLPCV